MLLFVLKLRGVVLTTKARVYCQYCDEVKVKVITTNVDGDELKRLPSAE
jgi:hypothetical protein